MWGKRAARRALILVGTTVVSMAATTNGVSAQPAFEPTFSDSQLCQTVDFGDVRLRAPNERTTEVVAVSLPAGTLNIPEAISWDGYIGRSGVPIQLSERWELQFLDAGGAVIATSSPTVDVPDGLERGEWIGSLGSVELPVPASGVRANLRNDLPPNDTPNSVHVSGVTLCFDDPSVVPPVCLDGDGIQVAPAADGTCPPAGPTVPNCVDSSGNTVTPNADGTCPTAPTVPVCTNSSGTPVTPNADGTCPAAPIVPNCVDSSGNTVTPNADGTCPAATPTRPRRRRRRRPVPRSPRPEAAPRFRRSLPPRAGSSRSRAAPSACSCGRVCGCSPRAPRRASTPASSASPDHRDHADRRGPLDSSSGPRRVRAVGGDRCRGRAAEVA